MDLKTLYYRINSFPEAYLFLFAIGLCSTNHGRGLHDSRHGPVINHHVVCTDHAVN